MCAAINLLAFPGFGTLLAGRRIGYLQAAIMLAGFFLVMGFMVVFFVRAVQSLISMNGDEEAWRAQYRVCAWAWKWGVALSAVAWVWSLFSSWSIVRQARPPEHPGEEGEPTPGGIDPTRDQ